MSAQTTYNETPSAAFEGMIAQSFSLSQIDSGLVSGSSILLGQPVSSAGSEDTYYTTSTEEQVHGIAVYKPDGIEKQPDGSFEYSVNQQFPVMKKGRFWGKVAGNYSMGTEVAWVEGTSKWSTTIDAASTYRAARVVSGATADGALALLEFDFMTAASS